MSRCFPYPPPGFIGKKASDALIDSIKLHKEDNANTEKRKEKRREKKEKKREKNKKKETLQSKLTEVGHEAHKDGKSWAEFKGGYSHKRKLEDTEQLEGSSVTEEHGQPLNLQNPTCSSDSTQNSNKRRKQASFASDSRGHGNIIRIKLPLQKQKESASTVFKKQSCSTSGRNLQNKESDVSASKEQCCSTSGRNDIHKQQICSGSGRTLLDYPGQDIRKISQTDVSLTSLEASNPLQDLSSGPSNELGCSTSGNAEVIAQQHRQITSGSVRDSCSRPRDKKMLKRNSQYMNLIQNLSQIALPSELVDNDEEWLFGVKPSDRVLNKTSVEKQFAVSSAVTCSGSSNLYPRARYLQEAEIFALPYTVHF